MSEGPPTFAAVTAAVAAVGLTVRGGFHPTPEDRVPEAGDGAACRTLVLIGNVGPAMWTAFARARQAEPDVQNAPEPLESWVTGVIDALGKDLDARSFYPFGVPPYQPFQRWAQRAEAVFLSPIGILIHPDYGLWHAYRGALAFADRIELPSSDERPSPCESCADKPCLSSCPVSAFTPGTTMCRLVSLISRPKPVPIAAPGAAARAAPAPLAGSTPTRPTRPPSIWRRSSGFNRSEPTDSNLVVSAYAGA